MAIGYKLFKIKNGKLFPLYVLTNKETKMNVWLPAESGELQSNGKVKAKLGDGLAYRPGWHLGDVPTCCHIGKKQSDGTLAQASDTVWCEVEYSDSINYQDYVNQLGTNAKGKVIPVKACMKEIPVNGFYRYKTNPNMIGDWIIAGAIKVNRILSREEVIEICKRNGYEAQKLAA